MTCSRCGGTGKMSFDWVSENKKVEVHNKDIKCWLCNGTGKE